MEGGAQGQPRCQSSRVQVQDRRMALLTRRGRQEPPKVGTLTRVPESFGGHEESCKCSSLGNCSRFPCWSVAYPGLLHALTVP